MACPCSFPSCGLPYAAGWPRAVESLSFASEKGADPNLFTIFKGLAIALGRCSYVSRPVALATRPSERRPLLSSLPPSDPAIRLQHHDR